MASRKRTTTPESPSVRFGELLRHHRGARTQRALAEEVGVASNYIALLEAGRRKPSRDLTMRLIGVLEITGVERDGFLAAALDLPTSSVKSRTDEPPAVKALRTYLATGPGNPTAGAKLRDVIRELLAAVSTRGGDRTDRSLVRSAELIGSGYFHSREDGQDNRPKTSHQRRVQRIEENLLDLLALVTDASIPITHRVRVVEELTEMAHQRLDDVPRRTTTKKKRSGSKKPGKRRRPSS